jgi:hypothetical protein
MAHEKVGWERPVLVLELHLGAGVWKSSLRSPGGSEELRKTRDKTRKRGCNTALSTTIQGVIIRSPDHWITRFLDLPDPIHKRPQFARTGWMPELA